jgi:NADP-dependent aldehyde dehydrogenase
MKLHGKNLLGGEPVNCFGHTFQHTSPIDLKPMDPTFEEASTTAIHRALELASSCASEFQAVSGEEKAKFLEAIAEQILALGDDLLQRAHQESGLPLDRLTGERGRTMGQLRMFANLLREGSWVDARIDPALPDRQPLPRPDLRRMLVPLGPVIVFGASNFPLAFSVAGGDTASALAAGCPVIVKAHPAHPGTSELVAGAINDAARICRMPPGVFSLIHGGPEVAKSLVKHPLATAVGFTGSRAAGLALNQVALSRPEPIPFFGELSSLNPVFLLPEALRERPQQIAEGLKNSFTLGVGQFCTKPGVVIGIKGADFSQFAELFKQAVENAPSATMLHTGIADSYINSLRAMSAIEDVEPFAASTVGADTDATSKGLPTVLKTSGLNFILQHQLLEEVFGPYTLLVEAESADEMHKVASILNGQLTATMHASGGDLTAFRKLIATLQAKAGRLVLNGFPTGVEVSAAMQHGGPFPATTDSRFTSVGSAAIQRWTRPVCFQNFPDSLLPDALRDTNPLQIMRQVDGKLTR